MANAGSSWGLTASLPGPVVPALSSDDIIVAATSQLLTACGGDASTCLSAEELAAAATCTGTATAPTAPEGSAPAAGANLGFTVDWVAGATGNTNFNAVWSYTAPTLAE